MAQNQLLLTLWQQNQNMAFRAIAQLTDENHHKRLTAESASAGFLLQHIGEAIHRILHATVGQPLPEGRSFVTVGGAKDEGQAGDPTYIRTLAEEAYAAGAAYIRTLSDAELEETVETQRWGVLSRAEVIGLLMYHSGYHIGQAMLAIKRGQVWN